MVSFLVASAAVLIAIWYRHLASAGKTRRGGRAGRQLENSFPQTTHVHRTLD